MGSAAKGQLSVTSQIDKVDIAPALKCHSR